MPETPDILLILAPPIWLPEAPPMGISYLYENLRREGFHPEALDLNERVYTLGDQEVKDRWKMDFHIDLITDGQAGDVFNTLRPMIETVLGKHLESPPPIVSFTTYHLNTQIAGLIARMFREKNPDTKLVFGGPSMLETGERSKLPVDVVDYVMLGEADRRLTKLVRAIKEDLPVSDIPGLLTTADFREPLPMKESFVVDELDPAIFPRYENYDLSPYHREYLPLLMSRGCPHKCAFCNDQFAPYRKRDPQGVIDEIRHHLFVHGVDQFFFCDQSLDASVPHLEKVVDGILETGLTIKWWGQLNIKQGMTAELLDKMRRSGCTFLAWGVESFSDKVLKIIRKPSRADRAVDILRLTHEAGISQLVYVITGLPGETDETFAETLDRVKSVARYVTHFSIMPCQATPFAPLREQAENFGINVNVDDPKDHWVSLDGKNTHEKRMQWLMDLARTLIELEAPFRSPVVNKAKFSELLGFEVPKHLME